MSSGCNNREYDRIKISLPVFIETSNGGLEGEIKNISVGGAFIMCGNSLNIGDRIYMAIANIPELGRHVAVRADLMWKNNCGAYSGELSQGVGVKFTKIDETDQEVLSILVSNGFGEGKRVS